MRKEICFLAVGNPLSETDSIGLLAGIELLKQKKDVFLCYGNPESFTSKAEKYEKAVIIDACDVIKKDFKIFERAPESISTSTHTYNLNLIKDYLENKGTRCYFFCINRNKKHDLKNLLKKICSYNW